MGNWNEFSVSTKCGWQCGISGLGAEASLWQMSRGKNDSFVKLENHNCKSMCWLLFFLNAFKGDRSCCKRETDCEPKIYCWCPLHSCIQFLVRLCFSVFMKPQQPRWIDKQPQETAWKQCCHWSQKLEQKTRKWRQHSSNQNFYTWTEQCPIKNTWLPSQ